MKKLLLFLLVAATAAPALGCFGCRSYYGGYYYPTYSSYYGGCC